MLTSCNSSRNATCLSVCARCSRPTCGLLVMSLCSGIMRPYFLCINKHIKCSVLQFILFQKKVRQPLVAVNVKHNFDFMSRQQVAIYMQIYCCINYRTITAQQLSTKNVFCTKHNKWYIIAMSCCISIAGRKREWKQAFLSRGARAHNLAAVHNATESGISLDLRRFRSDLYRVKLLATLNEEEIAAVN